MLIRPAGDADWPLIYPCYAAIMAEGKTYPFPEDQSEEQARPWWMEPPPGQTVVAVRDGEITGSAKMGANRPGTGRFASARTSRPPPSAECALTASGQQHAGSGGRTGSSPASHLLTLRHKVLGRNA